MNPLLEVVTRQRPDAQGKLHPPHPDHHITVQGPIPAWAFLWAVRTSKSVTVVTA